MDFLSEADFSCYPGWLARIRGEEGEDFQLVRACGVTNEKEPIDGPPAEEQEAADRCSHADFDGGELHDMFAGRWVNARTSSTSWSGR